MIHYSVVPQDQIWDGFEDYVPTYYVTQVSGIQMQVEPVELGMGRIIRIYSPDPQMYLNPDFSPGALVSLRQ
ncbi:YlzJ-like family protein [Paenibacillus sp. N1-5-1-14]|uniref:YlzJ-like family protein n=1 Tax=Paenibacillus radicibacter TaxID=2972488 RepID=UPI0021590AA8|nr:YlzJ-like family protein [Paenibacillus radicibacter]MCR8642130.1 YlzJ-like family protein [Paenibacillus radicibacter]